MHFIWSVYVYLRFRGLYESYPQNESEEFVEWKSALYDSFFCKRIVDSSNDVWRTVLWISALFSHPLDYVFVRNVPMALAALAADGVTFWIVVGSMLAKSGSRKGSNRSHQAILSIGSN